MNDEKMKNLYNLYNSYDFFTIFYIARPRVSALDQHLITH